VGGDAEDVHAVGDVLDEEERIQLVQGEGVEMEQRRPGWIGSACGR
jgi:hypothetical protein